MKILEIIMYMELYVSMFSRYTLQSKYQLTILLYFMKMYSRSLHSQWQHNNTPYNTGHPIVGDAKYGAPQTFRIRDIALHSYALTVAHPVTKAEVSLFHRSFFTSCPLCSLLASKSNYVSSITVWLQYNKRIWPYPLLPCIILYIFLIFCRWDLLLLLLCHGKKGSESKQWLLLRNWGRRSDRLVSSRIGHPYLECSVSRLCCNPCLLSAVNGF